MNRVIAVALSPSPFRSIIPAMLDKSFAKWFIARVGPFTDVPPEKLAAEREALQMQQDYNRNYAEFLNGAVLPSVDALVKMLAANRVIHRVSAWGNQLS